MTDTPTTAAGPASDVPDFPMPRATGCPFDPPPALRTMQAETPITRVRYWDGSTPWLITRYDDQRALFTDPRVSSDGSHPNHPHQTPGFREKEKKGQSFIKLDDPEHARLRRMVTAPFSVKRSEALRPAIQKIVDGLIDDLLAGPKPADLVEAFALAVPSLVICDVLGVSYSHHAFFQENSKQLTEREVTDEQGAAGHHRLAEYIDNLLSEKLANPGNDVLSDIAGRVKAGELTREEAVRTGVLLLVAGHDTTANMIALGILALLQHPDQLAILRQASNPAVTAGAVEELLRYLTIAHGGRPRVALADIEIGGQVIHAGDPVLLAIEMANRDPAIFPDPDQLDILREARHHVAFLYGPHQCLGQNLARVELEVVYDTLFKRIPTLRLATDMDKLQFRHNATVYGLYELPVTW
jgi:cytochrome P450